MSTTDIKTAFDVAKDRMKKDWDGWTDFDMFQAGYEAATEAAKATGTAGEQEPPIGTPQGLRNYAKGYAAGRKKERAEAARQPAPVADNDAFKEAYMEWIRKTDWVQEQISSFPPSALGMHRADVMRKEIERLRAALAATSAPVLSDALEAMDRAKLLPIWGNDVPHKLHVELDIIFKALAATRSQP